MSFQRPRGGFNGEPMYPPPPPPRASQHAQQQFQRPVQQPYPTQQQYAPQQQQQQYPPQQQFFLEQPYPQFQQQPVQFQQQPMQFQQQQPIQVQQQPLQRRHSVMMMLPTSQGANIDVYKVFTDITYTTNNAIRSEVDLHDALLSFDPNGFTRPTLRLFFRQCDGNGDNVVDLKEFCELWRSLNKWRTLYAKFDTDKNGRLTIDEYVEALIEFGFKGLSKPFVEEYFGSHAIVRRPKGTGMPMPGEDDFHGGRAAGGVSTQDDEPYLTFDCFVQSCYKINNLRKAYTERFPSFETNKEQLIQFQNLVLVVHKLL